MNRKKKLTREDKIKLFSWATQLDPKMKGPKLTDEQKRHVSAMHERARCLDFAQSNGGPGYYHDRKFREFVREYNSRVFATYGSEQPESFNILKDFVEPDDLVLALKILPERFLSLDINFILDKLTDPTKNRKAEDLFELEEGRIYSVAVPGGYEELQFVGVDEIALFGWSCIRHGDELSVFALAAKSNPEKDLDPVDVDDVDFNSDRPFLTTKAKVDPNHEEFYDFPSLFPVIFLTRLDLSRGTVLVRYILTERKDAFDVFGDNRQMYSHLSTSSFGPSPEVVAELFDKSNQALSRHSEVFSLLSELPHVLLGISDNEDMKIVRTPTQLHLNPQRTSIRRVKKILSPDEAPNFVEVETLVLPNQSENQREFGVVEFKVEQKGYWKELRPDQKGVGKNGDQIMGKTWVTVTESWEESFGFAPPENSKAVSVRSGNTTVQIGEVYVMRNAQHPKDVHKVGFTTKSADERASQLESTSGQPDQFGVMQTWQVSNPRRVEGMVHERLARFRTNPKREFFKAKFSKIRETIENVIKELDADLST